PHTNEADCSCRKPKSGMMLEISARYGIGLAGVPAVGDSLRDLEATARLGASPYLVLTGKGSKTKEKGGLPEGTLIYPDLAAVAASLL
ncbi:MAG: HAD hydrolase-like protein, partial [Sideroxydans sp.]|nr:HAD hydrolase-like protein [Sideroxydans sp.]